jgi:hypothetical protein
MKKLFLVAAMTVAALSVNAQSKVKPGTWSIQPKAGVTITSITGLDEDITLGIGHKSESQVNVGATIGGEVEYQIDNRFSVAAGVGYIMQGKQWDDYEVPGAELKDLKIDLGYINVPIVANYYIFKGLAVKAGVQFAFMTNAKYKYTLKTGNTETKTDVDIKDNCKTFDFSIPVGVSYEFDNHIVIDARYNIGVTKVFEGSTNHNSVLLATVGYKFRL